MSPPLCRTGMRDESRFIVSQTMSRTPTPARAVYNRRMTDGETAARYHRWQLRLAIARVALLAALLLAVQVTGAGRALAEAVARLFHAPAAQVALVALVLGASQTILGLPLGWLSGFELPRRYGLLHQPLGGWLADRLKAAVLGGAVALAGVEALYALLR